MAHLPVAPSSWSSSAKAVIDRLIEQAAEEAGVADRVTFAGAVGDDELVDALSRRALCLVYVPFDEDYGLATLEAFLAEKPVITARDSGGTLEFVRDGVNGFVVEPDPGRDRRRHRPARRRSRAGRGARRRRPRARARRSPGTRVIERLLSHG